MKKSIFSCRQPPIKRLCPNKATFSAACSISVAAATGRTRSPGRHPLRKEAKVSATESCRAARRANRFCPEYRNFLCCAQNLCRLPLPSCPFPGGLGGGGAALSSLCRRFPGGDIMNLTSRRSPLSGLSFSEFFFLRRKKNGLALTQSQNLCR